MTVTVYGTVKEPALRLDAPERMLASMARPPRGYLPAGVYHVMTRSAGPISMFRDDEDRTRFCGLLERTLGRHAWTCCAFCLMTTHFHLVLDVPADSLKRGMQELNWAYARRFNARHGRKGHLVGERYGCVPIKTNRQMLRVLRYVARNPVKAGLCKDPADWYWGSYADCAWYGETFRFVDHSRMRVYFGRTRDEAVERLRAFVEA